MPGRAVFLDRDGVLNRNILYADTSAYESPRSAEEVVLTERVAPALLGLQSAGYRLILVSNQPNAAKGKCTREALDQVHARLVDLLAEQGVALDAVFYCYHHGRHTGPCACRKPGTAFLLEAAARFDLTLSACWMIGDRQSDVLCGQAAGTRTVWIDNSEGEGARLEGAADVRACSLPNAVARILSLTARN